jgi:hypothetical protein
MAAQSDACRRACSTHSSGPMRATPRACQEHSMMDAIMLAIGLGLFAVSVGYVVACDRL